MPQVCKCRPFFRVAPGLVVALSLAINSITDDRITSSMPNTFCTTEKNHQNPWLGSDWHKQVQWRSIAAGIGLLTVIVSAPLTRWHTVPFKSLDTGSLEARSTVTTMNEVDARSGLAAHKRAARKSANGAGAPTAETLSTNPSVRTDAVAYSTIDSRCNDFLSKTEHGEPLYPQQRAFLLTECK
jgi:hypothetical protein